MLLKARVATLEADKATLQQELEILRVDSVLQLQDIHEKDALIEELRTNKDLTGPNTVAETQGSGRPDPRYALMADLEASRKEIQERDQVIQGLQEKLEKYEKSRPITEGVALDDHATNVRVEKLRSSKDTLEKQLQQVQGQNGMLQNQFLQAEQLAKALLKQFDVLLAVTETFTNNEGPRQERLGDLVKLLKVSAQNANNRSDYLASKADKDPAAHVKTNANRAAAEATAISDAYVQSVVLAGELTGDFGKARAVSTSIRRDFGRLLATTGPSLQVHSTQSSIVPSTVPAWTKPPSGLGWNAMPSGSATVMSPLAKPFSPGSQPTQSTDTLIIKRRRKPTSKATSKDTTALAGKEKLPVTDEQGFTSVPLGKPGNVKGNPFGSVLDIGASSKNPFALPPDNGRRLPELPEGGKEPKDDEVLNAGQQDKKADSARKHSVSAKDSLGSLSTEAKPGPSTAKVAMPATPPAAPRDQKSASRTELHGNTKSLAKPTQSPDSVDDGLPRALTLRIFADPEATPPSTGTPASMAQVAAFPPPASDDPYIIGLAEGFAQLFEFQKEVDAKLAKQEADKEAEKAKIKSKVPDSKKIANAAPGKVVQPGKPRATKPSKDMEEISELLGGKLPGKWGDSEEPDHPDQGGNKASESSSSQQPSMADVTPPQANPEETRNPTGEQSSLLDQSGQVAQIVSEGIGSTSTTAVEGQPIEKGSSELVEGVKVDSPIQRTNATNSQSGDPAPVDTAVSKAVASTLGASASMPPSGSVILGKRDLGDDEVMFEPQSNPPKRIKKGNNNKYDS